MPYLQRPRRWLRYCTSIVLTAMGVSIIYPLIRMDWAYHGKPEITDWVVGKTMFTPGDDNSTACAYLAEMDKILVILKTGATEALDKVPVHFETTLRCIQHYVIFSDCEEDIFGVHTRDILRSVGEETRQTNPDFEIYNRLRTFGREGLMAEDWIDDKNGPYGKPGNPGWKLDKWKFVPMIGEALLVKPDAHWYIFLEADTYIIWHNMVRWLARFDQKKPHYLGTPMRMGSEVFGYGGAGIALSNSAMQLVSQYRTENFTAVEQMTADDWAGDHVLGKILDYIGVPLVWSWPLLVPSSIWEFEYFTKAYGRQPWCYPAVSFHHMSSQDIQDMWLLEQQWFRSNKVSVLLHKDIFEWRVYDGANSRKDDWDNLSSDQHTQSNIESPTTTEGCARSCSLIADCLQFSFSDKGCLISKKVIAGVHRAGVHSGWMVTRVKALMKNAGKCPKTLYITG